MGHRKKLKHIRASHIAVFSRHCAAVAQLHAYQRRIILLYSVADQPAHRLVIVVAKRKCAVHASEERQLERAYVTQRRALDKLDSFAVSVSV